ncbi:MAG TPA: thiamine-phosphate kinase [Edaphobacter sp.]|nr:thiamine-phosphate kinase [Edaphobacter sp.]
MSELALIEQIRREFATARGRHVALGIGDDCAILRPPAGSEIVVTTDFTLEGRHFLRGIHPAESVGHRALARGLSDLAAMGAEPLAAFLSLALPAELVAKTEGRRWIARFFAGLRTLAERSNVPLAGGDTSESPRETAASGGLILADIVLVGATPKGRALRRSGAKPGDLLYVTGQLGGAAAELARMLKHKRPVKAGPAEGHPHLFPEPRLAAGRALLKRGLASACIDLSDGLSTDLAHLCRASGVHAEVEQSLLSIHSLAGRLPAEAALHAALHGGEDYELLFAAPAGVRVPKSIAGVSVARIGRVMPKREGRPLMVLVKPDNRRVALEPAGWEHFSPVSKN